jgi:hypothetical protein
VADVEIVRGGAELLDALRPLWLALRCYQREGFAPIYVTLEDTTRRR